MNRTNLLTVSLCIQLVLTLTYCTVEKRRYTKGYYITSKSSRQYRHANEKLMQKGSMTEIPRQTNVGQIPVPEISHSQSRVYTNAERYLHPIFTPKKLTMPSDSCSDLITFMDGTELKIRVEEITPEYVAYRRCDYLDGPLIKSATAEIFRIKYGTGMVRVFEHAQPPVNQQTTADYSQPSQKTNGWAVASFVSACFSFLLIPAFAAVIMGIIALVTVEKNPGKFKGKWMAVAGLVIGVFSLIIFLLLFIV